LEWPLIAYAQAKFCQNRSSSSKAEIGENANTLANSVQSLTSLHTMFTEGIYTMNCCGKVSLDVCFVHSMESSCNKAVAQLKIFRIVTKQALCCTYNVILRRVRVTNVAAEK